MASMTLGYWDIRGFAQPIRLMLSAVGQDFVEETYTTGLPPHKEAIEGWFTVRHTFPLDFPNLPYLYDGDVKITQSIAILRYLGRKFGMDGKTEEERIRIDLIEQQLLDWRGQSRETYRPYEPNFEENIEDYKKEVIVQVEQLAKFLGANEHLSGGGLSHVDFVAHEWLDVHELMFPGLLTPHPNLQELKKRIESIPGVKEFIKSDRFITRVHRLSPY